MPKGKFILLLVNNFYSWNMQCIIPSCVRIGTTIDKPTHRLSNTLDLIIHDADSNIIPRIKIDRLFSDHNIVLFDISTPCTVTN